MVSATTIVVFVKTPPRQQTILLAALPALLVVESSAAPLLRMLVWRQRSLRVMAAVPLSHFGWVHSTAFTKLSLPFSYFKPVCVCEALCLVQK